MSVASLKVDQLKIEGVSIAGEETWFRIHPPGLAFDAGRGAARLMGSGDLFLSHGHLDHALGVPYLLSQRRLQGLGTTRVFCPQEIVGPIESLVRAAEQLDAAEYDWALEGLQSGDRIPVGKNLVVETFATDHVVPSLGFHLLRSRKRLKPEFRELAAPQIVERKRQGVVIEETSEDLWLSYCGDTGPGVFDLEPRLFEVEILMLECTFFEARDRERAGRFKHIHIEDLAERSDRFQNGVLALHHTSRRYSPELLEAEIERALHQTLPEVHLLS